VMEEKMNASNIEVASVTATGYHVYTTEELEAVIARQA